MTPLSTFPSPLARLILCGGGGLPPATGELYDGVRYWLWDARHRQAVRFSRGLGGSRSVLECPEAWSLPLDAASPWPERLAVVAAWMVHTPPHLSAAIVRGERGINLGVCLVSTDGIPNRPQVAWWDIASGKPHKRGIFLARGAAELEVVDAEATDLPWLLTLPAYLSDHPPAVALPLALYDVPEIRARVEAL